MALRVWLPLNGNINNYGISDVVVTNNGATVDNNGKIGKCYKFDGTYLTVSTGLPANPTIFSFCSWVKLISGYAVNNGCHLVALGNNCRICVSKDSAAIRFIGNNATVSCSSSVLSSNLIADVWYHVAVIFDNGNVRMYLNGVKVADSNIGATSLNLSNNMSTQVGSYSTELSKAYMNDFRIYDHALSPKEVKEIAKGLVLHYKLDRNGVTPSIEEDVSGYSNNGIITGSLTPIENSPRYSYATQRKDLNSYITVPKVFNNNSFTISCWAFASTWETGYFICSIKDITDNWFANIGCNGNKVSQFAVFENNKAIYHCTGKQIANGWHHFVGTFDGITAKLYIDGILISSATRSNNTAYTSNVSILYSSSFIGAVSDFRIYATALSDADVLELYNTPLSIDNVGNMYTYEFKEIE